MQDVYTLIQPELASGEKFLWGGQPSNRVTFHKSDRGMIPFSLLWGGFAIFWEAAVTGFGGFGYLSKPAPFFFMLWGISFVVIGQYMIWGRFLYDAWLKPRTYYAVTDRRVIVVQNGFSRRSVSAFIDSLPAINKEGNGAEFGSIRFGAPTSLFDTGRRRSGPMTEVSVNENEPVRFVDNPCHGCKNGLRYGFRFARTEAESDIANLTRSRFNLTFLRSVTL
jgi:hypothetical protein